MISLSRSVHVSLAYRYWNSRWSHEENRRRYGLLASPEGVGGNWRVEIGRNDDNEAIFGPRLASLKGLVDHRCLFTDLADFEQTPCTLENVTVYLAGRLFASNEQWSFLTVHENDRISCTVRPDRDAVELNIKILNLSLTIRGDRNEDGLMTSREQVTQSVIEIHRDFGNGDFQNEKTWAETLFAELQSRVAGLVSLRVDLGQGKYIVVGSS